MAHPYSACYMICQSLPMIRQHLMEGSGTSWGSLTHLMCSRREVTWIRLERLCGFTSTVSVCLPYYTDCCAGCARGGVGHYCFWFQNTLNGRLGSSDSSQSCIKRCYYLREKGILPSSNGTGLWQAKYLYDSAHHPDTGDRQNIFGRMSFQVPGGMLITGILLAFYR